MYYYVSCNNFVTEKSDTCTREIGRCLINYITAKTVLMYYSLVGNIGIPRMALGDVIIRLDTATGVARRI